METPEIVAERVRKALAYVPPECPRLAPDCGMKYLSREKSFAKLKALVAGAQSVQSARRLVVTYRTGPESGAVAMVCWPSRRAG